MALGIGKESKYQAELRDFRWWDYGFASEPLGLCKIACGVVHLHVEGHMTVTSGSIRSNRP